MNINHPRNILINKLIFLLLVFSIPHQSLATHIIEATDAIKNPTDVPPAITRQTNKTVTIDLVFKEVITDVGIGEKAWVWTFNGTVPGPMIRVMEGDTVEIKVSNPEENLLEHDIDLHAVNGPGGGANVTLVEPGDGTKSFIFKALKQGAYIYHCAADGEPWVHVAYGMYGLIYVEPLGGLPAVDKEFYFGINEWYFEKIQQRETNQHNVPNDTLVLNEGAAEKEQPNLWTLNGHKNAQIINAEPGDKVRIFYVDGGPNIVSHLGIPGITFTRIFHGHYEDAIENNTIAIVPPGAASVIEFLVPQEAKQYTFEDSIIPQQGALGILNVIKKP